jgi:DNA repair protein RAD50
METIRQDITAATDARTMIEGVIASLQTEIAKADSLKSNISANIRYRKEEGEIKKVQHEIEGIDIEGAARSRKEFNSVYKRNLEEETEVQNNVSPSGGLERREGRGQQSLGNQWQRADGGGWGVGAPEA